MRSGIYITVSPGDRDRLEAIVSDPKSSQKGRLFDGEGTVYSPASTKKKSGQIYRYYISQNLIQFRDHPKAIMARIPAHEIEQVVCDTIRSRLIEILALDSINDHETIQHITAHMPPAETLVGVSVNKVVVGQDELQIDINPLKMQQLLQTHLNLVISEKSALPNLMVSVPFTIRRAYRGAIQIQSDHTETDFLDMPPTQLKNLIRGIIWRDEHFAGTSMNDIAQRENLSKAGIRKIIMGSLDALMAI